MAKKPNAYAAIIDRIFAGNFKKGMTEFEFAREDIAAAAVALKLEVPKNLGDVIYTFRYRNRLPEGILATQPKDRHWLILGAGDARYRFRLSNLAHIKPTPGLLVRKNPDATPEIIIR